MWPGGVRKHGQRERVWPTPIGIGDVSDAGSSRRRSGRALQGPAGRRAHRRQTPGSSRLLMLPFRRPGGRADTYCYLDRRLGPARYAALGW